MRVLVIGNYDSFVGNLAPQVGLIRGEEQRCWACSPWWRRVPSSGLRRSRTATPAYGDAVLKPVARIPVQVLS
jgi:hypothetical protein